MTPVLSPAFLFTAPDVQDAASKLQLLLHLITHCARMLTGLVLTLWAIAQGRESFEVGKTTLPVALAS
jgi:uncharacterized membrane protein YwaF